MLTAEVIPPGNANPLMIYLYIPLQIDFFYVDWSCSKEHDPDVLCLYKVRSVTDGAPGIEFSLTVKTDLSWRVHYCGLEVSSHGCSLLATLPPTFSSVSSIVQFLGILSTSRPCIGNSDQRFLDLMSSRSGGFKDAHGMFLTSDQ